MIVLIMLHAKTKNVAAIFGNIQKRVEMVAVRKNLISPEKTTLVTQNEPKKPPLFPYSTSGKIREIRVGVCVGALVTKVVSFGKIRSK